MGNRFRRLSDFSPLSVKNLNDQLEQLWLKVMGGISYRDLDKGTQNIINGKTDENDVLSIIEQNTDSIIMAVGSSGGDNLVKNGNFQFGIECWQTDGAQISGGYMSINDGYILQENIPTESETEYTLGFEGYGNAEIRIKITGVYASGNEQELLSTSVQKSDYVKRHRTAFSTLGGMVGCHLRMECDGVYDVKKVYIREGKGVDEYVSNPNELFGSDVSITQEAVSISTSDFTLNIKDEEGNVKSVLSTDGAGFDDIICSNITVNDRKYIGSGNKHIYVNSGLGSDSNSGSSTYYPFKTIGRALKDIPAHITDTVTLHLSGGEYYEDVYFNYGGSGSLKILGESATVYGHIFVNSTGYAISISNLKIYSRSLYGFYGYGGSAFVDMNSCIIDCNGQTGSYGIFITNGFRMYIKGVEVNNCDNAIYCTKGCYLDLLDCMGDKNNCGVCVCEMAIINCDGTVPMGSTITRELTGGRIEGFLIGGIVGENYLVPRSTVLQATFNAGTAFSYDGNKMATGVLKQGNGNGTFFVFNTDTIKNQLTSKVIKSVKIVVKRRGDDGLTHDGTLKGYSHGLSSLSNAFGYIDSYGDVGTIKRGEQVSVELLPAIIDKMLSGTVKGVLFYDNSNEKNYVFEFDSSFNARLEVLYV